MKYLHWKEEAVKNFSEENISSMYENGFVFTRIGKGVMHQTRSARVDLAKFELTSENRRILKKVENMEIRSEKIPYEKYSWEIGKLAKDFYESREADFSANKIKEIMTSVESNFNLFLNYSDIGFTICYTNKEILHYSYPFYNLAKSVKDMGLGMMIKAILLAKEKGLKYFYMGSLQRPTDVYKLQFEGLEWFDGKEWQKDVEKVKNIL